MAKFVILCVDDEPGILKSLERCLAMDDYEVILAQGGEAGLQLLEARGGKVDLIIVDQRMPGMMGDDFLRCVQKRHGPVKAVMLSGYADFEGLVRAVNDGHIFQFIQKPWDNGHLLQTVKTAVRTA